MSFHSFISYATADATTAEQVCAFLEQHGVACWIAPRNIRPGSEYDEAIVEAIEGAAAIVFLLSAHANESPYVKNEISIAFAKRKTIVTLRIADILPSRSLEFYLGRLQWTDAFPPPLESHMERLVAALRNQLDIPPDAPNPGISPDGSPLVASRKADSFRSQQDAGPGALEVPESQHVNPASGHRFTFVLIVQDVFFINSRKTTCVTGELAHGACTKHQRVAILNEERRVLFETIVEGIAKSHVEVEAAREGDEVGLLLKDVALSDISIGMTVVGLN